jgi:tetratricopeptide (TPR) repeat protein
MRNLRPVLLSLLAAANLAAALVLPALADDAPAQAADGGSDRKGKKGGKPAKPPAAQGSDPANLSPEQIIDLYTSKNAPAAQNPAPVGSNMPSPAPGPAPVVKKKGHPSPDPSSADTATAPPTDGGPPPAQDGGDDTTYIKAENISDDAVRAGELNNVAVEAMNAHEFKKAIDTLNQAMILNPNYLQGRSNLRICYFNFGVDLYNNQKYKDALEKLEIALAIGKQIGNEMPEINELYEECKKAVAETEEQDKK